MRPLTQREREIAALEFRHSPWFKRILNPILRKLQVWTDRPYVICSIFDDELTMLISYQFRRMEIQ